MTTTIAWFTLVLAHNGLTVEHDGGDHEIYQVYNRRGDLVLTVWCEGGRVVEIEEA